MAEQTISSTTQQYLDIHDITNDLVIMKDGTTSLILTVDAMNFGLLAEEEQDSIIYAYAGLLNSLNYPIQVLVRSQTKDVTSYLRRLQEQEAQASTQEKRHRIGRYREFVSNLIHERNVLDKKFYVVIPAGPLELGLLTAQSVLPGQQTFDVTQIERSVLLEKAQNILEPKRDHIISQFARIGLYSNQLTTQEIIQLFYLSYNPEAAEGQGIADSNSYTTPLVKASFEGFAMPQNTPNNPDETQATQPGTEEQLAPVEQPTQPPTQPQVEPAPAQAQQPAPAEQQAAPTELPNPIADTTAPDTGAQVTPTEPQASAAPTPMTLEQVVVENGGQGDSTPNPITPPPTPAMPSEGDAVPPVPVESQTIQKPEGETSSDTAPEEAPLPMPTAPPTPMVEATTEPTSGQPAAQTGAPNEVNLTPNQEQQVQKQEVPPAPSASPEPAGEGTGSPPPADDELTAAQDEINKTLGELGSNPAAATSTTPDQNVSPNAAPTEPDKQ